MYALKTYKLVQDADKVWNGKKWEAGAAIQNISNSAAFSYTLKMLHYIYHNTEQTTQGFLTSHGKNKFPQCYKQIAAYTCAHTVS